MQRKHGFLIGILLCISLTLLAACTPATPSPTATATLTLAPSFTPTPTLTPSPTSIPSPTPTATPIPPLALTIHWPQRASALEPPLIEVALIPPPGVSVTATVSVTVLDPEGAPYWRSELTPQGGRLYVADEPLQLPLEPPEGDWRLTVQVRSTLEVEGEQEVIFQPTPIRFRELTDTLPSGVDMRVPWEFVEVAAPGNRAAGGRVWRYGDGEVALWWAPGPVEPLLLNNAVVMVETTHDPDIPVRVLDAEEIGWQDQIAFLFREHWSGVEGGPSEALVVQGSDYRLYVLRVRAMGGETIPPLLRQVWETFAFVVD
jgi:hypothetical protein